jgi:hypothetical protein
MSADERKISEEELEQAEGEQLPDREEMTILPIPGDPVGGGFTIPVEPPATE